MKREIRAGQRIELRTAENGRRQFTARVVNYGVPDTYKTSWAPGVFARSLGKKLPPSVWAHDWHRPIGKVVAFADGPEGLDVTVEMADPDEVPDARMAISLIEDGIISEYSFAFIRQAEEPDPLHRGVTRITDADLDEVSPVLVGSVPGTRTLSVRADETVSRAAAVDLMMRLANGNIDIVDALYELKQGGTGEGAPPPEIPEDFPEPDTKEDEPEEIPVPQPQPDPIEEAALAKLDALVWRTRRG